MPWAAFGPASEHYFTDQYAQRDERVQNYQALYRVGDGALVAGEVVGPDGPNRTPASMYEPRVVGRSLVRPLPGVTAGTVGEVVVENIETGQVTARTQIPHRHVPLASGEDWTIATRYEETSTAEDGLFLLRPDGTRAQIAEVGTWGWRVLTADDTTALVQQGFDGLYLVDVRSGQARLVHRSTTGGIGSADLGPSRVFWTESGWPRPWPWKRLSWVGRDGSPGGSVDVESEEPVLTLGDGVLVGAHPVDLATGGLQPPVLPGIVAATKAAPGVLLLRVDDGDTGRVVLVRDGSQPAQTVRVLPPIAEQAGTVSLVGDRVVATFRNRIEQITLGADHGWAQPAPALPPDDALISVAGDVVLTHATSPSWNRTVTVTWPGGSRSLDGKWGTPLGRGGQLLSVGVHGPDGVSSQVQETRTGTVLTTLPPETTHALDGSWLWRVDGSGRLVGTDLLGSGGTRTVATGSSCLAYLQVVGRWAAGMCSDRSYEVHDLRGVLPPQRIRGGSQLPKLGDGYLAWVTYSEGTLNLPNPPHLSVTDLSGSGQRRTYGPLRGAFLPPGPAVALDDAGRRALVYADPQSQLRFVDLSWLGAAPTTRPDTTAPTLVSMAGTARTGTPSPISLTWRFTDQGHDVEPASGLASYDVRYQQALLSETTYGAWKSPAEWQGTTGTTVSLAVPAGTDTCLQVRARDRAGNLTTWSPSRCSAVPAAPAPPPPTPQGRAVDHSCPAAVIASAGFVDVPASSPFTAAVDCVRHWQVANGTSATTYYPLNEVTREQMAAFISRLITRSGGTLPSQTPDAFTDDNASTFQTDINRLAAAGIVNGTSPGTYSPRAVVTRAQMAAFLTRAHDYRAAQGGLSALPAGRDYFPDDDGLRLEAEINKVAAAGFAAGNTSGTYQPGAPVRRDHMAAFLSRVLDLIVENRLTDTPG